MPASRANRTAVCIEVGAKRVFACALDWPGWCRSGKDEAAALGALAAAATRYAVAVAEAKVPFTPVAPGGFTIVERLAGSATTDFGAPGSIAAADAAPLRRTDAERAAAIVAASWRVFDRVVARAPASLRKGPRGGGRDRDAIVEHVLAADVAYARKLGIRMRQPAAGDQRAIAAFRDAVVQTLRSPSRGPLEEKSWPPRYAARRIAWHALDHAWEIEDRTEEAPR